jgi:hypothetical protein
MSCHLLCNYSSTKLTSHKLQVRVSVSVSIPSEANQNGIKKYIALKSSNEVNLLFLASKLNQEKYEAKWK